MGRMSVVGVAALVTVAVTLKAFADPVFAKPVGDNFAFYEDEACTIAVDAPETGIADCVVLFADDAEYQALIPHAAELATAFGGMAYLQGDVTLTADTDWRAMDFNLNGKTITLKGWSLQVRKPQGEGRITAGNLIVNGDFDTSGDGWTFSASTWRTGTNGSSSNDKPYPGNIWLAVGTSSGTVAASQVFTVPADRRCYVRFRYSRYSSNYAQYLGIGIDANANIIGKNQLTSSGGGAGTDSTIYARNLTEGEHTFYICRWNGYSLIDEITVSPESRLVFDIPEGEEYVNAGISLGSTESYFFDGMGLQVHKTGKGRLVMAKSNPNFGGNGNVANMVTLVVEEGVVETTADKACGPTYSRIQVMDGAQFAVSGEAASNTPRYDFTIAGSGPDGLGAVVNTTGMADEGDLAFIMRNVTLTADATIGGPSSINLKNGNWTATTMTLDEHALTFSAETVYAGNVTYSGAGSLVIPTGTDFTFYGHDSGGGDCDVTVSGRLIMNNGGFSAVKSLTFDEGASLVLSDAADSGSIPTTVITGKYVPARQCDNACAGALPSDIFQLGDASHLETTLDLSAFSGTMDGSNTAFYAASTVTVDVGTREFTGGVLLIAWSELPDATFVLDEANKDKYGLWAKPDGLYVFPGTVPSFVKFDAASGSWKFYDENVNPYDGEWTLGMDYMKVLFADEAEFQALVPHTNEIAAAHAQVYLQDDVVLTGDTDWREIDFNMNGKTIVLRGWDLYVHKPKGTGRITSGNILNPEGYTFVSGSSYSGDLLYLGSTSGGVSAMQNFTLVKARPCHFKTQTTRLSSEWGQYVSVGINSVNNLMGKTTNLSGTQTWGPYTRTGLEAGTSYQLQIARYNGHTRISKFATLSPTSYLYFDIPEGEEFDLAELTLGGSTPGTTDFGGLGLQVHKLGKGTLVMPKSFVFGGNGITSLVVEEGLVKKASGATCGEAYSRIVVEEGAQFDLNGRTYHDYDYTISGSGPDGTGALISSVAMDAGIAFAKNTGTSFLRNVTLGADATVYAGNNIGMIFYNYEASAMTMEGHTVTYDCADDIRIFAGNMSYSGEGKIVIAENGWFQTELASPSAGGCDLEVYGRYWQNMNAVTPVKSLVFKAGSAFRELSGDPATNVVYSLYAPPVRSESEEGYNLRPIVQLGDADHLETTLDLSGWTELCDDSEEASLAFFEGSTVTVDIGDRTEFHSSTLWKWSAKPANVNFVCSEKMRRRGFALRILDDGIHFVNGMMIIIN